MEAQSAGGHAIFACVETKSSTTSRLILFGYTGQRREVGIMVVVPCVNFTSFSSGTSTRYEVSVQMILRVTNTEKGP